MARRDEYESRVEKFLIPIMEENNFELVDVEYVKEAGTWYWHFKLPGRKDLKVFKAELGISDSELE